MATSSAQIEGIDGRAPSIWDRFAAEPGRIEDGSNPSVACGHFERWREDLESLDWLGVNAYRFSIAWPRVLPEGRGLPSAAGLDFYDRLVDRLLELGVTPFVTLYHWDLPASIQDGGGWCNRDTVEDFADFARVCGRRLGDRVPTFVTHNEPWCAAMLGHEHGVHAPGMKDRSLALAAAHHMLLSHGRAVQVLRAEAPGAEVGIVQLVSPCHPASGSEADRAEARRVDAELNRWFIEPVALGTYPKCLVDRYLEQGLLSDRHPALTETADLDIISVPTDFLGLNYYSRIICRAPIPEHENEPRTVFRDEEGVTTMGWEVYPDGLIEVIRRGVEEWRASKIYITESGAAYDDQVGPGGTVLDELRCRYLERHLEALEAAVEDGLPVGGFFFWSLLDNFEWAFGLNKRFGLFRVDPESLERSPKKSAFLFRSFLASSQRGAEAP